MTPIGPFTKASESMHSVTARSVPVNPMPDLITSQDVLAAARELDRQYLADAVIAFELAEIAAQHEQDEIGGRRPKPLDQLSDADRSAFIAHAKLSLRMSRPAWRALQLARMHAAAVDVLTDYAGQWIPRDHIDALAQYVIASVSTAGRYVMDEQTAKPTPREFATAIRTAERRGAR